MGGGVWCGYTSDSQPGATWPPRGEFTRLGGGNTEHLGYWGGMDPFGGNQQLAINSPGCSSGTGHFGHSAPTKMDTGPMKDNIFSSEAFILLTKTEMHYRRNEFQNFLQNLALDAHDGLHRKSTLAFIRHCSRVGGMIN